MLKRSNSRGFSVQGVACVAHGLELTLSAELGVVLHVLLMAFSEGGARSPAADGDTGIHKKECSLLTPTPSNAHD